MKILYIASGTGMAGGATKSFLAMLREADKAGISYEVVCPDEKGLTAHLRSLGKKVHVVHYRHACLPLSRGWENKVKWLPRLIHNSWINVKGRKGVMKIARKYAPDIIHENSSAIDVGYHAAKAIGVPDVIHIREYGDLDFKMKLPGRKHRLADSDVYTISITKDIAGELQQDKNPRATQIYNGIVTDSQIRYTPGKKPYFLYAGRIEEAKGIGQLLAAYSSYAKKKSAPLKLLIAGGTNYPEYASKLKRQMEDEGLSGLIEWLGERKDTDDLMYEATATIIPSRFEALGRVMPEAMANGCLCVGRNTGGTKEQMDNALSLIGHDTVLRYETTEELSLILEEIDLESAKGDAFQAGGRFYNMIIESQKAVIHFFSESSFGQRLTDFYDRIMTTFS